MLSHSVIDITFIYKALFTSVYVTKCYTETQPKSPISKQCRCRSTVARKNSLESQEPRRKQRGQALRCGLFWLCWVEIITVHGQNVQTFKDDQQGQIIITVVVEGATGLHLRSTCQLACHSWAFRVRDSRCGRERERESWKQQVQDKVACPVNRLYKRVL
jgi:hypothetical protein